MVRATYMVGVLILLFSMVGCTTTIVRPYDGPCPLRPELEPISVEMQIEMQPKTVLIVAQNQLKLKQHIIDLEDLSGCEQN